MSCGVPAYPRGDAHLESYQIYGVPWCSVVSQPVPVVISSGVPTFLFGVYASIIKFSVLRWSLCFSCVSKRFFGGSTVLFERAGEYFEIARHLLLTAYNVNTCSQSRCVSTARFFGPSSLLQTFLRIQAAHNTPQLLPQTDPCCPPTSPSHYDKWRASVSALTRVRVLMFVRFQCACVFQSARAGT